MKAIIEIEITGDFTEELTEEVVHELLDAVIKDGAESVCMNGKYRIIEVIGMVEE